MRAYMKWRQGHTPVRCISLSEQVGFRSFTQCTAPNTSQPAPRCAGHPPDRTLGQLDYAAALHQPGGFFRSALPHDFPPQFAVPRRGVPELEALVSQLGISGVCRGDIERMFRGRSSELRRRHEI